MLSPSEMVSIVLFKGSKCPPCKPVDRHLKKIVESSKGRARLTVIDTDIHTEFVDKYGVRNVPHVLYNDEVVLTGTQAAGMLEASAFGDDSSDFSFGTGGGVELFQHLFNQLVEASMKAKEFDKERWQKLSMLMISEKTRKSVDLGGGLIRPTVGDFVHIGVLQSYVTSILAINPSSQFYLYQAGRLMGSFGGHQFRMMMLHPKLMEAKDAETKFKESIKGLKALYGRSEEDPFLLCSDVEVIESDDEIRLRFYDSAYAIKNSDAGLPLCYFLAGEIAGTLETLVAEPTSVREEKCWGIGDEYCEFLITLGSDKIETYKDTGEFFTEEDRLRFEISLATISENTYSSSLYMTRLRPQVGDYVHISVLQHALNGIKFSDPFYSTLLYYAGLHYGSVGADVRILDRVLTRQNLSRTDLPLEFEDGCKILESYFVYPTTLLSRNTGEVYITSLDDEIANFQIHECATASGIDIHEESKAVLSTGGEEPREVTLCDFSAGFIAGRMGLLIEDDVMIDETNCHSTGAGFCEFELKLD